MFAYDCHIYIIYTSICRIVQGASLDMHKGKKKFLRKPCDCAARCFLTHNHNAYVALDHTRVPLLTGPRAFKASNAVFSLKTSSVTLYFFKFHQKPLIKLLS